MLLSWKQLPPTHEVLFIQGPRSIRDTPFYTKHIRNLTLLCVQMEPYIYHEKTPLGVLYDSFLHISSQSMSVDQIEYLIELRRRVNIFDSSWISSIFLWIVNDVCGRSDYEFPSHKSPSSWSAGTGSALLTAYYIYLDVHNKHTGAWLRILARYILPYTPDLRPLHG